MCHRLDLLCDVLVAAVRLAARRCKRRRRSGGGVCGGAAPGESASANTGAAVDLVGAADLNRQYVFRVLPDATKPEIKAALEELFSVKVEGVTVCNVPA